MSLSVRCAHQIKCYAILVGASTVTLQNAERRPFATIDALLRHYTTTPVSR